MSNNILTHDLPTKRLKISDLNHAGIMSFAISILCIPFLSLGQSSLKAQVNIKLSEKTQDQVSEYYTGDLVMRETHNKLDREHIQHLLRKTIDDLTETLSASSICDEEKAIALNRRGVIKGELGYPREALDDFRKALSVLGIDNSTKARALMNSGVAKWKLGDHQAGSQDFDEGLAIDEIVDSSKTAAYSHKKSTQESEKQDGFSVNSPLSRQSAQTMTSQESKDLSQKRSQGESR